MHLARFRRARDQFYRSEAETHWNQGFSMTTSQIPQVGNESYHAFYIFSMLSCIYKLAKGPAPGDFLYFEEPGRESSEWLIYCKGHLSFLMFGLDALRSGPLAQLFEISTQKTRKFFTPDDPVDPDPIADLRKLCKDALGTAHPKYDTYKAAIDNLSRMYSALYNSEDDGDFSIFVWMLSISKEFFPCIQQRDPVALVIFAYFVVLLDKLSPWWVLDGWTHHLMFGIYNALSIGTKQWIRWPMEKTGWIPP
ncbi:Sterol uptake control protein 2 [Neofusicoccum parvum]|uniref:Sterol uptake control protein 2 n=1 Tax=Neofusicoccum parvum TaxID=310453 RepID=A0ACB5SHD9_9PEZI|nr:Sterol uptake control protein 2 [Neofusicoccum parvum]GME41134.1 Sterol uptake control protein 2 [Neofusicoccum parvum]